MRRYWAPKAWFSVQLSTIKVVNVYCSQQLPEMPAHGIAGSKVNRGWISKSSAYKKWSNGEPYSWNWLVFFLWLVENKHEGSQHQQTKSLPFQGCCGFWPNRSWLQMVYKPIKCQLLSKLTLWFVHLDPWRCLIGQTSHSRSKPEWAGWVPCIVKPCTSCPALVLLLGYHSIVRDSPARLSFHHNWCLVSTKFGPKCVMCLINKLRIKLLNVRPSGVRCTIA